MIAERFFFDSMRRSFAAFDGLVFRRFFGRTVAAWTSAISGRTVTHVPLPADALREGLLGAGLPPAFADGLVAFDVATAEGFDAIVTPTVRDFAGREPTSVEAFLAAHKDAIRAMV